METNPVTSSIIREKLASTAVLSQYAEKVFRSNWKILSLIGITPIIVILAISIIANVFGLTVMGNISLAVLKIIVIVVEVSLVAAMIPAMLNTLVKIDNGETTSFKYGVQFKEGFKFFWPLLGLAGLQALIIVGASMIFIIPGIILNVYLNQFMFARILDGKKGFSAFIESYSLVKGRWWTVLGRVIFLVLAVMGWSFVVNLSAVGVVYLFGAGSLVTTIIRVAFEIVMVACMYPVIFAYMYKLYHSLKETREADIKTTNFKTFLVAFLVIGVFVVILVPIASFLLPSDIRNGTRLERELGATRGMGFGNGGSGFNSLMNIE
ncbi:MAG: hypothetical protein WCP09_03440 [Candidatus Taylorbacteria bacterium]